MEKQQLNTIDAIRQTFQENKKGEKVILDNYTISISENDFYDVIRDKKEVEFDNCDLTIIAEEGISQRDFDSKVTFTNCSFYSSVLFRNLVLHQDIILQECTLNANDIKLEKLCVAVGVQRSFGVIIKQCRKIKNIKLDDIRSYGKLYLDIELSKAKVSFTKIEKTNIKLSSSKNTKYINYNFDDNVGIELCSSSKSLEFENCSFQKDVNFNEESLNSLIFRSCSFFGELSLNSTQIGEGLICYDSEFSMKVFLLDTEVNNMQFVNCKFNETVKIVNIAGELSEVNFERSTIKGMFFFNAFGEGEEIVLQEKSRILFHHIFIDPAGYLIIRNINSLSKQQKGYFDFEYANILGAVVFQDICIDKLLMKNASIVGSFLSQNIDLKKVDLKGSSPAGKLIFNPQNKAKGNFKYSDILANRESAYILKKAKQEEGDGVSSTLLKRDELDQYLNTEFSWYSKSNRLQKALILLCVIIAIPLLPILLLIKSFVKSGWFKNFPNFILLYLNKISNDFGQSWVLGIIFTILCATLFYFLINYIGLESPIFEFNANIFSKESWNGFGEVWKGFLKIINLLNFNDKFEGENLNAIGETLFFVSKIFISYGIYQTVSAFRKFGK